MPAANRKSGSTSISLALNQNGTVTSQFNIASGKRSDPSSHAIIAKSISWMVAFATEADLE